MKVVLLETILERALLQIERIGMATERDFINVVLAAKNSLTAASLNDVINKLVEVILHSGGSYCIGGQREDSIIIVQFGCE